MEDLKAAPPKPKEQFGNHEPGNQIAKHPSAEVTFTEMPDIESLNKMKVGKSLVAKYRTQEDWIPFKDKLVRCYFMGLKEIPNDKGEIIKCAVFVDETGVFLCAQKMILDGVQRLFSGTPIGITYKGKKKNKSSDGSINLFDVVELGDG